MSKHPKTSTELKRKSRAPSIRDSTGAAGIALIHQLAIASGFIFREPTGIDLGLDTQIEVFSEKKSRGYVLIQSKCTIGPRTSWKRVPVTNASVLLEYWRSMRSPVILIQSQLAKHEGDHRVFQATRLRAIDISEESIEYTKDAILWDPEKAKSANTVSQWTTIESVLDFKNFLLNVSSRQEIAARHNAIWLSDSALDSSDFDAAAHAIDVYEKTYAAVSSVNIAIQRCRILRRRGAWHPKNTKISLEHYLPTKIAPPLTEKLTKEQCQVLQEIGYSFVVGALKEWAMDHTTKIGREYLSEGLRYLAWWKESKETKDDCETFDYMLYGQQIEYVMNRGSVDAMNETAEELTRAVTRNASGAAEASLSLWRQALI